MDNVIQLKDYRSSKERTKEREDKKRLDDFFEETFFVLALTEAEFGSGENASQNSSEANDVIGLDFIMTKKQQEIFRRAVDADVADIDGFFYRLDCIGSICYDDLEL